MNIFMFGPPGCGKGTHGKKIAEYLDIPHISTGEIFRNHMKNNTEIGIKIKEIMDSGNLVPDEITNEIIRLELDSYKIANGFVLDGYPRKISQVYMFDKILEDLNIKLDCIINLDVSLIECSKRLKNRASIEKREDDANFDVIENRFDVYLKETLPCLKHYYEIKDIVKDVKGNGTMDEVFERIKKVIDDERNNKSMNEVFEKIKKVIDDERNNKS